MKNNLKNNTIILLLLIFSIYFILNTNTLINIIVKNTNIFINNIFPPLFLFFIISDLLLNYNFISIITKYINKVFRKIFRINSNSTYIFLMSLISGFPSGTKYITNLLDKNMISVESANRLIMFTHFSNIAFILGSIATIIKDYKLTIFILISHFISNFIIAIITRGEVINNEKETSNITTCSFSETLSISIIKNIKTLLIIYGTMIFFSCFSYIVTNILPLSIYQKALINGLIDLSSGTFYLQNINLEVFNKALLILSFISFGSITVHMQVMVLINNTKVKYKYFLIGRIIQVAISIILFLLIYWCFY